MNAIKAPAKFYLLPAATLILVFACGVGAGLLLGGSGAARAAGPGGGPRERFGPGPRGGMSALLDELQLTSAQREQMEALLEKQRAEMHEACSALRPRIEQIHAQYDPLIREILTEAQWQRWQENRAKWMHRPGGRGKNEAPPPRVGE
jgi:Spy/CpxP family protein refolding chaperone